MHVRVAVAFAAALVLVLVVGAAYSGAAGPQPAAPSTLAVVSEAEFTNLIAFGDGKIAWTTAESELRCKKQVRIFSLATRRRTVVGSCDQYNNLLELVTAAGAVVWSTNLPAHSESHTNVYAAVGGRTTRLASYDDSGCDTGVQCWTQVFATGGHAFVSHAGTLVRVAGPRLEPVGRVPGYIAGAEWPLAAVVKEKEVGLYRLTDAKRVGALPMTAEIQSSGDMVLSATLLAARGQTPTADLPRRINHVYDVRSGRRVAVIRDERIVAILGRRIVTLAPPPGVPRFRLHEPVPLRRFVIRSIGGSPRLVAAAGGDVLWAGVRSRRLYWIEQRLRPLSFRLRAIEVTP